MIINIFLLLLIFNFHDAGAQQSIDSAPASSFSNTELSAAPNPKPSNLDKLKTQAKERKIFYKNQANARRQLRDRQAEEENNLLTRHRANRKKFLDEKHTPEERKVFFLNQRHEMAELKARHENEKNALTKQLAKQSIAFNRQQKQDLKN